MSTLHRVDFRFDVRLRSDLHIGTGELVPRSDLRSGTRSDDTVQPVLTIVRDGYGKPVIPATAIKGVLRKACERHSGKAVADTLFGAPKLTEWKFVGGEEIATETGGPANLTFFAGRIDEGASVLPATDTGACLPFLSADSFSFIATHVAISRRTGAAEAKKLYNVEMVPAGAVFRFEGFIFADANEAESLLDQALGPLASVGGLNIGHGISDGHGAIGLVPDSVVLIPLAFNGISGEIEPGEEKPITISPVKTEQDFTMLTLHCPGPYFSLDPSAVRPGSNRQNVLPALKRNENEPVLWPQSVMGVLRQRAAWLAAVAAPQDEEWDERFRKPASWRAPSDLRVVERLFGVTGWRSLVRVQKLSYLESAPYAPEGGDGWPGVEIDPITGGARDQVLFFHECFTGVKFALTLELEERRSDGKTYPLEEDRALWAELLADIGDDGLLLGHGVSRGFGWFDVAMAEKAGE